MILELFLEKFLMLIFYHCGRPHYMGFRRKARVLKYSVFLLFLVAKMGVMVPGVPSPETKTKKTT